MEFLSCSKWSRCSQNIGARKKYTFPFYCAFDARLTAWIAGECWGGWVCRCMYAFEREDFTMRLENIVSFAEWMARSIVLHREARVERNAKPHAPTLASTYTGNRRHGKNGKQEFPFYKWKTTTSHQRHPNRVFIFRLLFSSTLCSRNDQYMATIAMSVDVERERGRKFYVCEILYRYLEVPLMACVRVCAPLCMHFEYGQNSCSEYDAKNCVYKIQCSLLDLLNRMETERSDGKQNDFHYFQFYHLLFSLVINEKQLNSSANEPIYYRTRISVRMNKFQIAKFGIAKRVSLWKNIRVKSNEPPVVYPQFCVDL